MQEASSGVKKVDFLHNFTHLNRVGRAHPTAANWQSPNPCPTLPQGREDFIVLHNEIHAE